jgi:hypothetical protein
MSGGNPEPLSYQQAQHAMSKIASQIRDAEARHREQIEKAGEALAEHKKALHSAALRFRAEGKGATESEFLAKTSVGDYEARAFVEAQMVKAVADELENRRGDRASLHRLVEWSAKVNPAAEPSWASPVRALR